MVCLTCIESIKEKLKAHLSGERFKHSVRVADQAVMLAGRFGADRLKAEIAGILHDCARDFSFNEALNAAEGFGIILDNVTKISPGIIHAAIGEAVARSRYGVDDKEVLDAIRYHTTGRKNMSLLEKIIFIADYTEPERDFPGVAAARDILKESLDRAVLYALGDILAYLLKKRMQIHPDTVEARNYLLTQI